MAYTPPAGNAVAIAFSGIYTPPAGNAVAIPFADAIPVPVATNEAYSTTPSTSLVVAAPGVLASDVVNGAALSVTATTTHGDLALSSNGGFVYTPETGYVGSDSFTYQLANTWGVSSAVVSLNIEEIPVPLERPRGRIILARVGPNLSVLPPPPAGHAGLRYLWQPRVVGPTAPYKVTLSGTLPTGLGWNARSLTVSGEPFEFGQFPVTITVIGRDRAATAFPFVITTLPNPITLIGSIRGGSVGDPLTGILFVSGGIPGYVLESISGGVPGVTFSMLGNVITASGIATLAGTFVVTFVIRDSSGTVAAIAYPVTIGGPPTRFRLVTTGGNPIVTTDGKNIVTHLT